MKQISIILFILTTWCIQCKKDDTTTSIVGKWYFASLSTKITRGSSCTLIDTVINYNKSSSMNMELTADNKITLTTYVLSTPYSGTGTYTYSNGVLSYNITGSGTTTMNISNLTSTGFSIQQQNRSYCTNPYTLFNEYMNYSKY